MVGQKIRKIRKLKGYSQDYMASKLDITQVAYSDLENSKTKISVDRLNEISSIFEMDINDILSFDDNQIFNNTFKNTSKGFFNVHKVINDAFDNEREAYIKHISFLKEEIIYLRNKLDRK